MLLMLPWSYKRGPASLVIACAAEELGRLGVTGLSQMRPRGNQPRLASQTA